MVLPEPLPDAPADPAPVAETVTLRTCGLTLELETSGDPFLTGDSLWRQGQIYERFLAASILPARGTLVDVGAGFGVFALPFARLFPGWRVWAFEPDPAACAALRRNAAALGLTNLIAVEAAVAPGEDDPALAPLLAAGDPAALQAALATAAFRRAVDKPGYVELDDTGLPVDGMEQVAFRALPAGAMARLSPDAAKIVAPGAEAAIAAALGPTGLTHLTGEIWRRIPSQSLIRAEAPARQVWLPLAGTPLALRHGQATPERRPPGLDVVVALYNAERFIVDCVASIVDNACDEVRAIVVDDGSTDGSAEAVRRAFDGHPRVRLLQKRNGGCASARNFGRRHSEAAHIGFVDADDVVDGEFFPALLELARYSGAEVVQGAFDRMEPDGAGGHAFTPSYEDGALAGFGRIGFGPDRYFVVPAAALVVGQPAIWRRIYRRDFLDNRDIWFPEHIRAFDDQIFQVLTVMLARDVYCRDDVAYHYRQHPGQDIKAGDERFFHSLEMFRLIAKRAVAEGWNDMVPVMQSYANTVTWIHRGLRPDLKPLFLAGAAELWVLMELALGRAAFGPVGEDAVAPFDFRHQCAVVRGKLKGLPGTYAFVYLDSWTMHPDMVRARSR